MGRFFSSNRNIRIVVAAVFALWIVCLAGLVLGALVYTRSTRAKGVATEVANPITEARIEVQPGEGYSGTQVKVLGANWRPGEVVFVRLQDPAGGADENYAYAGAVADDGGSFATSFSYPFETRWLEGNSVEVIARAEASGVQAKGEFRLAKPAVAPTPTQLVTATPTDTPEPPLPTVGPGMPTLTPRPRPTLPPPPPVPQITDWKGVYFANPNLQGQPVLIRNDQQVSFDWGMGGFAQNFAADNFSVQWTRGVGFDGGNYRFSVRADDGVRLFIDDRPVIDQWHDSGPTTYYTEVYLTPGSHNLRMDYFERIGWSTAQLSWERLEQSFPDWKAEYYADSNLGGSAAVVRNDPWIDFNWGGSQPAPNIPADNFSARWTRKIHFNEGNYRFSLRVDDGARLWVDDNLIVDQWHDSGPTTYVADRQLSGDDHSIRLEYYDRSGGAEAHLWWERGEAAASYPEWKAEYYSNKDLDGDPKRVRNDQDIDFDWGSDSPTDELPRNDFSVRWTRKLRFDSTATYQFKARVDGGVRLYVDDDLLIDSWEDGSLRTETGAKRLSKGDHELAVEYFDDQGDAVIEVSWQKQSTTQPTPTRTVTPPPTDTPGPGPSNTPVPQPTGTAVVEPTNTPATEATPSQASLTLAPAEGEVNSVITVFGTNWPAGQEVILTLAKPQPSSQSLSINPSAKAGVATATSDGEFKTTITLPAGEGWENESQVMVVAFTADFKKTAVAPFGIHPSAQSTEAPVIVPTTEPQVEPTATEPASEQPSEQPVVPTPTDVLDEQPTPVVDQPTDTEEPKEKPSKDKPAEPTDTPEAVTEEQPTETPPEATGEQPNDTPVPAEQAAPIISLVPVSGTLNITLTVQGAGWPAGSLVGFSLTSPIAPQTIVPLTGTVQSDEQGAFVTQLFLPAPPGWEQAPAAAVVAITADQAVSASAPYSVTVDLPVEAPPQQQ